MRTKKEILQRWKKEGNKWDKLSQLHANCRESHIRTHVTKDEHITGERLSFVEGWIHALEWMINDDKLLMKPSKKILGETSGKKKRDPLTGKGETHG